MASTGTSILDFTDSDQDLQITFQYDDNNAITGSDRMESTIRIADDDGDTIQGISHFVEYYDMDNDDEVNAFNNATWNQIEGSDYGETIFYEGSENIVDNAGQDHRYTDDTLNLRGGENRVSYYALETSISAVLNVTESDTDKEVEMTEPVVRILDGNGNVSEFQDRDGNEIFALPPVGAVTTYVNADGEVVVRETEVAGGGYTWTDADGDALVVPDPDVDYTTGSIVGTVNFYNGLDNGDQFILEDSGTHRINSYTSDNDVAAGSLKLEASQDAEDDVMIISDSDQLYILGTSPGVIDVKIGDLETMRLTGFEFMRDTATNDVYRFEDLNTGLTFIDNAVPAADRDTIMVTDDAVGYEDSNADEIDLQELSEELGIDFNILDITMVEEEDLILMANGNDDELIVGDLDLIDNIDLAEGNFNTLWLTDASVSEADDEFILNMNVQELQDEDGDRYFDFEGDTLNLSRVTDTDVKLSADIAEGSGASVTLIAGGGNDEIIGAEGNDVLIGGAGNDEIAGGVDKVLNEVGVELSIETVGAVGNTLTIGSVTINLDAGDQNLNIGAAINAVDWSNEVIDGVTPVSVEFNAGVITFEFNEQVGAARVAGAVSTTDGNVSISPAEELAGYLEAGAGDDTIYGGLGVDDISAGIGNDNILVIGKVKEGDYKDADVVGVAGALGLEEVLTNNKVESDVSTDKYDGGDGVDTLEVWGAADFTKATITDIENVVIHSNVTFTSKQLAEFNLITADDGSVLNEVTKTGTVEYTATNGVFVDKYGNELDFGPENTAPVANNDSGFSIDAGQSITIDAATLLANDTDAELDSLTITGVNQLGTNDGTVVLDVAAQTLTFIADADFHGTAMFNYTVFDGSLYSEEAAVVEIEVASGDEVAPELIVTSPADGAAAVAVDADIVLTFSEAVQAGTGDFVIYNADGTVVETIAAADAAYAGATVTIDPVADLANGANYYVGVAAGAVEDLAGNDYAGIADATTLNFSTVAEVGVIDLVEGTTAPVEATAEADQFTFDAVAALAMNETTQIQITEFDAAADTLQLDIETAGGVSTLDTLDGVDGIGVETNLILDATFVNFGANANGDVVIIELAGVTDPSLVNIETV